MRGKSGTGGAMIQSETLLYDGCLYRKVGTPDIQKEARKRLKSYEAFCSSNRKSEKELFDAYESELLALIDAFLPTRPMKNA